MKDILVLFASKGDEASYNKVIGVLEENKADYEFKLASAHKTPDDVDEILKQEYKVVISGAGLAAALPGVVAAKSLKPVIGVPCSGNYEGLDALLTIMQMPPGVPVMGVGVGKGEVAARQAINMLRCHEKVTLAGDSKSKAFQKAEQTLKDFGAAHTYSDETKDDSVNIVFTRFNEPIGEKNQLVIYCPLIDEGEDKAEASLNLLKHSTHGLWVGLNNGKNAALAALEILNIDNKYEKKLKEFREKQAEQIRKHNK